MALEEKYRWIHIYEQIANGLLKYRDNRKALLELMRNIYSGMDIKYPFTYQGRELTDICPFTVFGTFNRGITDKNRNIIISKLMKELDISGAGPESFEGIPVFNNMNAWLVGDDHDEVERDWKLFETAISFADDQNEKTKTEFVQSYDDIMERRSEFRFTVCLYWIRPNFFLNLDNVNRAFLKKNNIADINNTEYKTVLSNVPGANVYLDATELISGSLKKGGSKYRSLPELSNAAWNAGKKSKHSVWMVPVNRNNFDIEAAFDNNGAIDWTQKGNYKIDDIVYIYLAAPASRVEFRCTVTKSNIPYSEIIDDAEYRISDDDADIVSKYARFELIEKRNDETLSLDNLMAHGLKKAPQGAMHVPNKLYNYIERCFSKSAQVHDDETRYWAYSPGENAAEWENVRQNGIMSIGWSRVGDLSNYKDKESIRKKLKETGEKDSSYMNAVNALWQFANEIKPGDIIFAKKGISKLIGYGVVESDYYFDESLGEFANARKVNWTKEGSWDTRGKFARKTLTDITLYTDFIEELSDLLNKEDVTPEKEYQKYSKEDFLEEVYMDEDSYDTVKGLLLSKKNLILQGAPGVGKTFIAKRLAYSIIGEKDRSKVQIIQFHQSYSYEDFIMGYRPSENGFVLSEGPFYEFSKRAEEDDEHEYFFIIDEINRGNLSKIFGELMMLIESDKRGFENSIRLLYKNERFYVPENLYIIGMMNTADRSLAMIDYALRRRFAFYNIDPAFESEGFKGRMNEIENSKYVDLVYAIRELNEEISRDESLGEGFRIGHSYMCTDDEVTDEWLNDVITYEIIPLIKEYWFDENDKVKRWEAKLRNAIK